MSNLKTHFVNATMTGSACGRGLRMSDNIYRVDCRNCQAQPVFIKAKAAADAAREAAYQAQEPRTIVPQFGRVNEQGVMECPKCQGILWRERPRSLFSYHYVCAACGHSVHPMTETGMST